MSRKMIDYQVENGKISTIDGYKVGGGEDKLTPGPGIQISEDNVISSEVIFTEREIQIDDYYPEKAYNIGDTYDPSTSIDDNDAVIVGAQISQLTSLINVGGESGPTFSAAVHYSVGFKGSKQRVYIKLTCIKAGTISTTISFKAYLYLTLIKNANYQYFN